MNSATTAGWLVAEPNTRTRYHPSAQNKYHKHEINSPVDTVFLQNGTAYKPPHEQLAHVCQSLVSSSAPPRLTKNVTIQLDFSLLLYMGH
jgi:hypothetical protein